ncbi:MAG: 1-(5-phosphoribosyl)-5-[(5-phosphoribosylamino)methylideneamino]imidazole-4-carboxamide isomerase [Bacteroidia bacterium]|jgi:phosphoribosylformimino-5-aminoimidazole carboxamide ribotide isomerase|nr:1-(5-phosphoribosyl)-5-[(5-phosphoribosylamino)methylideneamino]imidazole-4-carboxamide isomerase [Bacteroidia bacterium]
MKKFEIIPAIDIIDGKCVRLSQGDYSKKTIYNEDPLEVAKQFEAIGISRLHLVDLDGAKKGEVVNFKVLDKIANQTDLKIDFGGGIKTNASIQSIFNAGADMATIGSVAVKDPELFYTWIKKYGSYKILLGADVKEEKIAISGWLENTDLSVFDFLKQNTDKGLTQAFCTDVSKDGMLEGPSFDLYKKIILQFPELNFIASGGVATMKDVFELEKIGCSGVIIGKAIYEGNITLNELRKLNYEGRVTKDESKLE